MRVLQPELYRRQPAIGFLWPFVVVVVNEMDHCLDDLSDMDPLLLYFGLSETAIQGLSLDDPVQ